ncbi:cytochrome P450 [Xylariaceae sp. FL1019]|nr:cytochrome P450 [Xylariaceae sp. FL1019]
MQTSSFGLAIGTIFLAYVLYAFATHNKALDKYPGPWVARWTNIWRLYTAYSAKYAPTMKELHEKYGPVVRTGPRSLDLDYPELGKVIYNTDGKWKKSDFYKNSSAIVNGKMTYNLFSEVDNVVHARLNVLALERHMDAVIDDLCGHLNTRFISPGKECDLGAWLGYYAWDFISTVTFSKRFGYMEHGCDFDGTHHIMDQSNDYTGICGQIPWLDNWLDKNPVIRLGPPNLDTVAHMAVGALLPRLKGEDPNFDPEDPDYLQYFIDAKTTHPDVVDDARIVSYLLMNLVAGADTTAITIRALFYHCLKNQDIWERLTREVRAANPGVDTPVSYQSARAIPYLEAVVRETMRIHPAIGMPMERIVPDDGLELPDGTVVPPGTIVGMNPYIIARNRDVFGADADTFRPERWLQGASETDDQYNARILKWNTVDLTFGGGSRICLGRHLSLLEVYKVVATLAVRYDIELVDPDAELKTVSRWFHRIENGCIICKLNKV